MINDLVFYLFYDKDNDMIFIFFIKQLISIYLFLSSLGSAKSFLPSTSCLPRKVKEIAKRPYSTPAANSSNLPDLGNNNAIKFDSLDEACEKIKYSHVGLSGGY